MDPAQDSASFVVFTSQAAWVARFLIAMGAVGLATWWAKEIVGLDLKQDINALEKLLHKAAEDGDVVKALPMAVLLLAGLVVGGYFLGGFIH